MTPSRSRSIRGHPFLDEAPVGLDLGFAGAPKKAETAPLTFKMGPGSNQSRFLISEMSKLDLQRTLPRARPAAKNFEDQSRAIDNLGRKRFFQVALLHRGQTAIHDDEVDLFSVYQCRKLGYFALAKEGCRTNLRERNHSRGNDLKANRVGKPNSFKKTGLGGTPARSLEGRARVLLMARARVEIRANHHGPGARLDNLPGTTIWAGLRGQLYAVRQ